MLVKMPVVEADVTGANAPSQIYEVHAPDGRVHLWIGHAGDQGRLERLTPAHARHLAYLLTLGASVAEGKVIEYVDDGHTGHVVHEQKEAA